MAWQRFERAWCGQAFLRELVLIYPSAAIMMQDHGVSALGLASLFMIWSASSVLFEVPTGVLADRLSRRNLLVVSGVVKGFAPLVWLAAPGFAGFAAGFVVWSFGSALRSGTAQAFLHDTLAERGHLERFERLYGREQASSAAGVALALLVGGWAAEGGYTGVLVLSALAPWSSALVIGRWLEEPARHAAAADEDLRGALRAGVAEIRSYRPLLVMTGAVALLPTAYEVLEEFVPPLLDAEGFSLTAVGAIYAGLFLVRTVALLLAHRLRTVSEGLVCLVFVAAGATLAATIVGGAALVVAALVAFFALSGVGHVLLDGRLQRLIRGRARATVTSVAGMGQEIASLGFYLGIGAVAQFAGWLPAVALAGCALALTGGLFAAAMRATTGRAVAG